MTNIMCTSQFCPMRDRCYRVQAKPSKNQNWMNFEYECHEDNSFYEYLPIILEEEN